MHKLQSVLANADPVRFSDLMVNGAGAGGGGGGGVSNELKIHVLKDLKAQQTMAGMSPVSSSGGGILPVSSSSGSSSVAAAAMVTPMWSNNLFDLPGMKADSSGTSCDLPGGSSSIDSGNLSGSTNTSSGGLNSSSTTTGSSNNNNNNEDSYEAGIADDMRELALRLESELNIN